MRKRLQLDQYLPEVAQIADDALRRIVEDVWDELWNECEWVDLADVPVSVEINVPHVPHNRVIIALAIAAADALEHFHRIAINRDVLLAAALLQDASKLVEMRPCADGGVEMTDIGRTYPHGFWGAKVAVEHGAPHSVCHIICTHTPQAKDLPSSIEGKILFHVDQLDVSALAPSAWKKKIVMYR